MTSLVDESIEATAWMDQRLALYKADDVFGSFASSVIWTNDLNADGEMIMPLDPVKLAAEINACPIPLLSEHDPGRPIGKLLTAEVFNASAPGRKFIAAVLGFYDGAKRVGFKELGLLENTPLPPVDLPAIPADFCVQLAADPKEVELEWLSDLGSVAPVPVVVRRRSHNSADATHALIIVATLFTTLVWNPYVKKIAEEAGKDTYSALRDWLRNLSIELAKRRTPILELQAWQHGCLVSFMFRGKDLQLHHSAHDGLSSAALSAANLIANMDDAGFHPVRLVYEFHPVHERWHPSFAELSDGRLITDNAQLVAAERLPRGLSLGLGEPDLEDA